MLQLLLEHREDGMPGETHTLWVLIGTVMHLCSKREVPQSSLPLPRFIEKAAALSFSYAAAFSKNKDNSSSSSSSANRGSSSSTANKNSSSSSKFGWQERMGTIACIYRAQANILGAAGQMRLAGVSKPPTPCPDLQVYRAHSAGRVLLVPTCKAQYCTGWARAGAQ